MKIIKKSFISGVENFEAKCYSNCVSGYKRIVFSGGAALSPTGAKMEAGVNPARSRHCDEGALLTVPLHSDLY